LSGLSAGPFDTSPERDGAERCNPHEPMSHTEQFANLLREFKRVGVDPNTISAGLAVREDDVIRALAALPDQAGPAAFLSQLRLMLSSEAGTADCGEPGIAPR
jgi:hypothetical protein